MKAERARAHLLRIPPPLFPYIFATASHAKLDLLLIFRAYRKYALEIYS